VTFDLSLAGLGGRPNLLTLAFEPPFLAATAGLLLTLLAIGWRAFCRFGPPRAAMAGIPPGKTTLVTNSAALIRRAGRLHLLTVPYVDALRERLAQRLGLRRGAGGADRPADRRASGPASSRDRAVFHRRCPACSSAPPGRRGAGGPSPACH
jgi:hypothetical protein